ncbi:MAG: choice-of-anchor L domain-containing protein [Flavobacteriales bacterium]
MNSIFKIVLFSTGLLTTACYAGFLVNDFKATSSLEIHQSELESPDDRINLRIKKLRQDSIRPQRIPPRNEVREGISSRAANFTPGFNQSSFSAQLEGDGCFQVQGITVNSVNPALQMGTFTDGISGAGLEIDEGIVLTTGEVSEAFTSNSSGGISQGTGGSGTINDADLDALAINGSPTFNEAIIEIDFSVAQSVDGFSIPFQFASDEYNEYVCSNFNDVFAVFIRGVGIPNYQTISLVPGTSNPVAINFVNNGSCGTGGSGQPSDLSQSALFIDNTATPNPLEIEFDGITRTLYARQPGLQPGNYQLKLAIADVSDGGWDSGVFFGAMEGTSGGVQLTCACVNDPLADPLGDCDSDGILNGNESDAQAALDPCSPNPLAVPTGDCDGDGILNQDESDASAALDPCDPNPLGLAIGDCDGDGLTNQQEANAEEAMNSCLPDINAAPTADCDNDGVQNSLDQCPLVAGVAPTGCPDYDADGIPDAQDIDDDNDGVLDHIESPDCFVAAEGVVITNVTTSLTNYDSSVPFTGLYNGDLTDLGSFGVVNTSAVDETIYELELSVPAELLAVTVIYQRSIFRNDGRFRWQGWNGTSWVNVTAELNGDQDNNGTRREEFIDTGATYSRYRIRSTAGRTFRNRVREFVIELRDYNPSLNPLATCAQDADNDTALNHQDLDSDADGCSDALEAGASNNLATNFQFSSADTNNDGLVDEVDLDLDGIPDYSSTYENYAQDEDKRACIDTDSDGVLDIEDIDDDNDGILDTTEDLCAGEISFEFFDQVPSGFTVDNMPNSNPTAEGRITTFDQVDIFSVMGSGTPSTYGVRYSGFINLETAGTYTFYTRSDDGSKLYISGIEVVDNDGLHASQERSGSITLAGGVHELEVLFFENAGNRILQVQYEGPSINKQFIPFSILQPTGCDPDEDGDGVFNSLDLDSDGDGCSDAFEAAATTDFSADFSFSSTTTSGDTNGNGLADVVEQGTSGQINYTSTYSVNALDEDENPCDDVCIIEDCDGDGFTNDEELAGICGLPADPNDFNSPFQHWQTTQDQTQQDQLFILETVGTPSFFSSSPISHLTVMPGHTLNLTADITVRDLIVSDGAKLELKGHKVTMYGDLTIDGLFGHGQGHFHMIGDCESQEIKGTSTDIELYELTIENAFGVTLETDIEVSGPIQPELGTFDLNGQSLVLISLPINGVVSTGSISEIKPNADVLGPITLQRYVESLEDGYRFLGPPLQDLTIGDISDDMVTTGFPGSDYPDHYFTNLKRYEEDDRLDGDLDSGYKDVQNVSETWAENQGYWAYFPPSEDNVLLDVYGEFNKGDITYDLSYTFTDSPHCDGWHCIVNPYPSAIDIESTCMTFTNVSETIYILDHTIGGTWQGEYVEYNNGISVNGGSNVIASFQAFMVQATGPNASITFTECAKIDEQGTFYRSEEHEEDLSFVRLALQREEEVYETVVSFREDATMEYDPVYDGRMWRAQMYSVASVLNGDTLSLNTVPLDQGDLEIPLVISVPEAGEYEFLVSELVNIPMHSCMYIQDVETGETISLEEGASFTLVTEEDNYYAERYILNYKSVAESSAVSPFCTDLNSGIAEVSLLYEATGEFTWLDSEGNELLTESGNTSRLENVSAGVYTAQISSDSMSCGTAILEVTVEPVVAEIVEISSTPDYCSSGFGSLKVNVLGAPEWTVSVLHNYELIASDSSSVLVELENLEGKVYDVIVQTECATEEYVLDLSDPDAVSANFENPGELLIQNVGVEVEIESLSENAENNEWYLDEYFQGDDDFISLTFDQIGSYKLRLNSSNERCEDDYEQELMVSAASVIEENLQKDFLTINKENEINVVRLNDRSGKLDITLYDIKGSKIVECLGTTDNRITINKQGFSSGVYILEIRTEQGQVMSSKYAH